MAALVYLLCSSTSALCTFLLFRGYKQGGNRLLLWSMLCFIGLTLNNILLFLDQIVIAHFDLSIVRTVPALLGIAILIYGLVEEME